jgi:PAS domain-containing protein
VLSLEKLLTAQKKTAIDPKEIEKKFFQFMDNLEEVFWMTDIESGEIIYVSPTYETIYRRKSADLYKDPKAWTSVILPDDRLKVIAVFNNERNYRLQKTSNLGQNEIHRSKRQRPGTGHSKCLYGIFAIPNFKN